MVHCPKCGQPQASDDLRYCSRCGFSLDGVRQLLAMDGILPTEGAGNYRPDHTPRRRGVRQGTLLLLIGTVIVPMLGVLNAPEELIGLSAILFFVGGLMRILYALLFQGAAVSSRVQPMSRVSSPLVPPTYIKPLEAHAALQPPAMRPPFLQESAAPQPASQKRAEHRRSFNTGELAQPPSVTEHTTRLLDDKLDEQPRQ